MNAHRWELIQFLFERYIDLPRAERDAAVLSASIEDSSVVDELRGMFAAADVLAQEQPPDIAALMTDLVGDPYLGRTVGLYKLEALLGQGGMGRVYRATRLDYGSIVAVKILYDRVQPENALITAAQMRRDRFLNEEQTLARLNHSGIAQLMDAGAEPDGTLYFVMEFVDGLDLLEYCESKKLDLRRRLTVLMQVCVAVQYAHQHSICHRDLKPSNILVKSDGSVKLLDFGISERIDARADTADRQSSGHMTLAYAAPEQILHAPSAVQADVYALGIVLHQLLAREFPFPFAGRTTDQIRASILHQEPARPSASKTRLPADRNQWEDLDAICAKALRKDPGERYASVQALSDDLSRLLEVRTVTARQPYSVLYRASKFARRNARSLVAATLVFATLAGLVAFYTYRLKQSRDEAIAQANRARDVQAFVLRLFKNFDPQSNKVDRESAESMLKLGEREAASLKQQPAAQADVFDTLGEAFENLGDYQHAAELFQKSLALRQRLFGSRSSEVAESMVNLGRVADDVSHFDEAEKIDRHALAIVTGSPQMDIRVGTKARVGLGNVLVDFGKSAEAVPLFLDALRTARDISHDPDLEQDADIGLAEAEIKLNQLSAAHIHNREALRLVVCRRVTVTRMEAPYIGAYRDKHSTK